MYFNNYMEIVSEIKKSEISVNSFFTGWNCPINKYLIPCFGNMPIEDITYTSIRKYFLSHSYLSHETLKSHYQVLNTVLKWAQYDGLIERNPCELYKLNVGVPTKERQYYTPEQTEFILDYCRSRPIDGIGVFLMLKTGICRAEMLGIKWQDIHLKERTIEIRRNIIEQQGEYEGERVVEAPTKNKHRNRVIAIDEDTALLIAQIPRFITVGANKHKRIPGTVVKTEYLIVNKFGRCQSPSNWSKRRCKPFMEQMSAFYAEKGVKIPVLTPHCLRHTRASIWLNEGRAPAAIAAQMGWSDLDMLSRVYGHRDIEQLRKQLGI